MLYSRHEMGWIVRIRSRLGWRAEPLRRREQLEDGRHKGRNFRRLKEDFDRDKDEKSA